MRKMQRCQFMWALREWFPAEHKLNQWSGDLHKMQHPKL
jgi:hypothetical protein